MFQQNTLVNDDNTCVIIMKIEVLINCIPTEQTAESCELAELFCSQSLLTDSQVVHLKGTENIGQFQF